MGPTAELHADTGCSANCLQPQNLDLICSNSTIYTPVIWSRVHVACLTFDARISGFASEPEAVICLFIAHHLSVVSTPLYPYACDSPTYSCRLPDLRREDIWLCLGARSCHLSIHCSPPFRHVHLFACDSVTYSCCSPDLRREDIWLCLGARSCHLSIHCSPPFRHACASLPIRVACLSFDARISVSASGPAVI